MKERGRFLQPCQPVESALQDKSGGVLIDDGGTFLTTDIGSDQFALYRSSRKPLVPQSDRQFSEPGKVAGECTSRLRSRAFAPIHIDRQAEDESDCGAFGRESIYARGVRGEGLARDGLDRRCKLSIGVTDCDSDRLRSKIEPDQNSAGGQMQSGFSKWQDDGHVSRHHACGKLLGIMRDVSRSGKPHALVGVSRNASECA